MERRAVDTISEAGFGVLACGEVAELPPLRVAVEPRHESAWLRIRRTLMSGLWDIVKVALGIPVGILVGWFLWKHHWRHLTRQFSYATSYLHAMPPIAYLKTDCEHCSGLTLSIHPSLRGSSLNVLTVSKPPHCITVCPAAAPAFDQCRRRCSSPRRSHETTLPLGREICETCGSVGSAVSRTKGSFLIELALWLLFCAQTHLLYLEAVIALRRFADNVEGR